MPSIVVLNGKQRGAKLTLDMPSCSIGRSYEASLLITDNACSRKHCAIIRQGDSYCAQDLGSKHGTSIDGVPVSNKHVLKNGTKLLIGQTLLLYTEADDVSLPDEKQTDHEARALSKKLHRRGDKLKTIEREEKKKKETERQRRTEASTQRVKKQLVLLKYLAAAALIGVALRLGLMPSAGLMSRMIAMPLLLGGIFLIKYNRSGR